jgi:hypothetical protein
MIIRKLRHLHYLISTRLIQSSIKHSLNINLIANRQITLSIGAFSSNQYSSFDPNIFISSICGELTPKATPDQWAVSELSYIFDVVLEKLLQTCQSIFNFIVCNQISDC